MPTISVIVPVYNVEKYLQRCVDSILAQTFSDFELLLVDDGSPDNCGEICDWYATQDDRVRVIHQKNGGLSAARNAGIDWAFSNSDSQWLNFIDSDDWVHPKYLETLYAAVKETQLKVSICGFYKAQGETQTIDETQLTSRIWDTEELYCRRSLVSAWGKLYERNAFLSIRFPIGKLHEDAFVIHRILFLYPQVAYIESPLYMYFFNPDGIMRSLWTAKRIDEMDACEEQLCFFEENGFKHAARHQIAVCAYVVQRQLTDLERCDEQTRRYFSGYLRRRLRRILRPRRRKLPLNGDEWIYETAYPWVMKWYWIILAQWNKIIRKLKNKSRLYDK